MDLLKIVLAIFLPPVAAFLQVGLSLHFFLNIVLTPVSYTHLTLPTICSV